MRAGPARRVVFLEKPEPEPIGPPPPCWPPRVASVDHVPAACETASSQVLPVSGSNSTSRTNHISRIGVLVAAFSPRVAANYFRHAGYAST